jgi:exportin-2 (importin alpha re-exporter)
LIEENSNNLAALQILARSLILLIKIYYDLNCQDLPEFFEDNLPVFMGLFEKYLLYQNPLLATDDEEEEGPLEQIKTGICYIIELYASRYEDEFPQLQQFVPIVIGLLTNAGVEPKYDTVSI